MHDDKHNAVDLNKWIMQNVLLRVQKLNLSFFLLVCRLFSFYSCMPGKPWLAALLPAFQCLACQSVADSWSLCFLHEPEAKFLVPYWGEIVNSNIGFSYRPFSLCSHLYPSVRDKEFGYCYHLGTQTFSSILLHTLISIINLTTPRACKKHILKYEI